MVAQSDTLMPLNYLDQQDKASELLNKLEIWANGHLMRFNKCKLCTSGRMTLCIGDRLGSTSLKSHPGEKEMRLRRA